MKKIIFLIGSCPFLIKIVRFGEKGLSFRNDANLGYRNGGMRVLTMSRSDGLEEEVKRRESVRKMKTATVKAEAKILKMKDAEALNPVLRSESDAREFRSVVVFAIS